VNVTRRTAVVRFTVPGFHRWPEAPIGRAYLADSHRHLFHVQVEVDVAHADREVEFHDLLDVARAALPPGDFGRASCEQLAERIGAKVTAAFQRDAAVEVWEDGEVGARITCTEGTQP